MTRLFVYLPVLSFLIIASVAPAVGQQDMVSSETKALAYSPQRIHKTDDEERRVQWGLSAGEWQRYKTLMKGIRGSISPANLSPIEVLGVHARNAHERKKYAEIWARMRHEDASRILAFQRAYNQAFYKLYGQEKLIDIQRLNLKKPVTIKPRDRILVFTKTTACPKCDRAIRTLLADQRMKHAQLDIYFTDTQAGDENKIRTWAKYQGIDKQRLKNETITLNHDGGNLYRITHEITPDLPKVYLLEQDKLTQLPY